MSVREGMELFPSLLCRPSRLREQSEPQGHVPVRLLPLLKGKVSTQQCSVWWNETGTFKEPFWVSFPDDSLQWTCEETWHVTLLRAALDTTAWIHFGSFSRALSPPLWDKKDVHVRYKMRLIIYFFIIFLRHFSESYSGFDAHDYFRNFYNFKRNN